MRRKSPDTVEDLKQANYEVIDNYRKNGRTIPDFIAARGFKIVTCDKVKWLHCDFRGLFQGKFLMNIPRMSGKKHKNVEMILSSIDTGLSRQASSQASLESEPFKYSSDDVVKRIRGIMMVKNDIYWKPIRDVVQRLFEAGITNLKDPTTFLQKDFFPKSFNIYDRTNHANVVLTLNLLSASFYAWLALIAVSLAIFVVEIIYYRLRK